jgi:hypothetical protein
VSIGASLYSAGSSVKNLAEFTSEGSTKTYARYDFSADFSMMKSSRHAGMSFDVRYSDDSSLQVYNDDESIADLLKQIKQLQSEIQSYSQSAKQMQTSYDETISQIEDMVAMGYFFDLMQTGASLFLSSVGIGSQSSIDVRIEDLQADADMFAGQQAAYITQKNASLKNLREKATRLAWRREYDFVKSTGQGYAHIWSDSEMKELLSNPKRPRVSGYQADHIAPVEFYPEHAGDHDNIQFLKGSVQEPGSQHYNKHHTPQGKKRPASDFEDAEKEYLRRKGKK